MIGIGFKSSTKNFFSTKKIKRAMDKGTRSVLGKFGGTVRKIARRSIRPAGKKDVSSRPGEPPRAHGESFIKKWIFYSLDTKKRTVVIGPVKLNRTVSDTALEALEYGGQTTVFGLKEYKVGQKPRIKKKRIYMKARPFMQPAYEKVLPNVSEMWKNSII